MCNIMPRYLLDFAENITKKNYTVIFNLKCHCNNKYFSLYKNKETNEDIEKRKKWESLLKTYNGGGYSDNSGNIYLIKKNLFGFKIDEIKINKSDIPTPLTIVKAKCSQCGKEFIIFDNSKNGYDAFVDSIETKNTNIKNDLYQYKTIDNNFNITKIKITNDLPYEIFIKEFPNAVIDDFANAFSEISIYILKGNNYKCIFNEETR